MVILLGNAGLMVSTGRVCPDDKKKWPDRRIGRRSGPMDLTKRNEVRRTTATLFHRDSHADVQWRAGRDF
jgi:hypothetical protein